MTWPLAIRTTAALLRTAPPPTRMGVTTTMTVDSTTQIVVCSDDSGTPLGTLYIRGMCEELGIAPTMLRWSADRLGSVPLWDARAKRSEVEEVLIKIMRRYSDLAGWDTRNFRVVSKNS